MPIQRWRCPAVPRVKSAVFAGAGVAIALLFFPAWFAIPVAGLLAAWGLGMAVRGATVALDSGAGLLLLRVGLITRRVRLTDITGVLVDQTKVSIARAGGLEISLYAWRKSMLDGWLRVPSVSGDIGHALASAVALAQDAQAQDAQARGAQAPERAAGMPDAPGTDLSPVRSGTSARSRSAFATALLGGAGLAALAAAFLVRLSWHNPVMTVLGVILALALGVLGLLYLLFALWLLLGRRSARTPADRTSAA